MNLKNVYFDVELRKACIPMDVLYTKRCVRTLLLANC